MINLRRKKSSVSQAVSYENGSDEDYEGDLLYESMDDDDFCSSDNDDGSDSCPPIKKLKKLEEASEVKNEYLEDEMNVAVSKEDVSVGWSIIETSEGQSKKSKCKPGERKSQYIFKNGKYHCTECDVSFNPGKVLGRKDQIPGRFYRHFNKVHLGEKYVSPRNRGKPFYKCDSCDFTSYRIDVIKNHVKIHSAGWTIIDTVLKHDNQSYKKGDRKNQYIYKDGRYQCTRCDASFKPRKFLGKDQVPGAFYQHFDSHLGKKRIRGKNLYKCDSCDVTSNRIDVIKNHVKLHSVENTGTFICEKCPSRFTTFIGLKRHALVRHDIFLPLPKKEVTEDKILKCDKCKFETKCKYQLKKHSQIHSDENKGEFKCDVCRGSFESNVSLLAHQRFYCHQSDYNLLGLSKIEGSQTLTVKTNSSTKTRKRRNRRKAEEAEEFQKVNMKFICTYPNCNDKFATRKLLDKHKMGQKHFSAQEMSKRKDRTGESKYLKKCTEKCDLCDRKYPTQKLVELHKWTMHDIPMPSRAGTTGYFECDECDKKFKVKDYLIRHKRTHLKGKFFECGICGNSYKSAQCLRQHRKKFHSDKN